MQGQQLSRWTSSFYKNVVNSEDVVVHYVDTGKSCMSTLHCVTVCQINSSNVTSLYTMILFSDSMNSEAYWDRYPTACQVSVVP
jgi:hypothetical protein